jgi:anti-anti-sigma regulatory factor
MRTRIATVTFSVLLSVCGPGAAWAQTSLKTQAAVAAAEAAVSRPGTLDLTAPRTMPSESLAQAAISFGDMKTSVYPVLVWVPAFSATTTVPAFPEGIVVAIILSLIGLASQAAYPRVHVIGRKRGADVLRPLSPEHPDDETLEGLLILRPEGRLFFVNAQYVAEQIDALVKEHKPRVLALDMSRVFDLEYSALQMLVESEKRATERGVIIWLAGLNPDVLETARRAGLDERLGRERMLFNARAAIKRYQALQASVGGTPLPTGSY